MPFGCLRFFSFKVIFFKKILRLSNILGPNLAQGFVGHDLGPSYLQRSSAGIKIVGKVLKFTFFVGHRQINKIRGHRACGLHQQIATDFG